MHTHFNKLIMRVWFSGRTTGCQSVNWGSIPHTRTNIAFSVDNPVRIVHKGQVPMS